MTQACQAPWELRQQSRNTHRGEWDNTDTPEGCHFQAPAPPHTGPTPSEQASRHTPPVAMPACLQHKRRVRSQAVVDARGQSGQSQPTTTEHAEKRHTGPALQNPCASISGTHAQGIERAHTHSSDTQKHTPLAHATRSQQGAAVASMARQVGSRLALPQQKPCWWCCHGSVLLPLQLGACCALRADLRIQRIQLAPHRLQQHVKNGQQHGTNKSE